MKTKCETHLSLRLDSLLLATCRLNTVKFARNSSPGLTLHLQEVFLVESEFGLYSAGKIAETGRRCFETARG